MLHLLKADVYGIVSVTVLAVELLNVSVLIVPDSILDKITRMAVYTVSNDYRRDYSLVLLPNLFSNLEAEFHSVNMLTANMSEFVVCTIASPITKNNDNIIIPIGSLRMYMVMIIGNSDQIRFQSNFFSFFLSYVSCHVIRICTQLHYKKLLYIRMSQYVYKLEIAKYNMVELKKMTRINSTIDSDLEKKFREVTFGKFGLRKGSIQEGLEEALNEWIKRQKKNERRRV